MTPAETAQWAQLTKPLNTALQPVIPPAARAAWDQATDGERAARRHDWRFIHRWSLEERKITNLLAATGVPMAGYDGTLPDEARAILPEDALP